MHFEVLSTKYANINHFRLFFWKFCYKISLFWAFFLEFFGLGNNLALKAPHYTRTTTLILCITFHFWVRMSFFENAGGFAGTPSLAVGLFYTCILQGARQVQGPCCTNPNSKSTNLMIWRYMIRRTEIKTHSAAINGTLNLQIWGSEDTWKSGPK